MTIMEKRNWEDLGVDCLVQVFKRVGMETLLLSVPFVCKSWHEATLDPKCWQILIFPEIRCSGDFPRPMTMEFMHRYGLLWYDFPTLSFAEFVASRSHHSATELVLPGTCSSQALHFFSEECPKLKFLGLSLDLLYRNGEIMAALMSKWKNLRVLSIGNCYMLSEIFSQIRVHCENFVGLIFSYSWIGREEAYAIASLPQIKYLGFRKSHIPQNNLLLILESCRNLEFLELKRCSGFEYDHGTRRVASHIKTMKYEEPLPQREDDDYDYHAEEEQARLVYNDWLNV